MITHSAYANRDGQPGAGHPRAGVASCHPRTSSVIVKGDDPRRHLSPGGQKARDMRMAPEGASTHNSTPARKPVQLGGDDLVTSALTSRTGMSVSQAPRLSGTRPNSVSPSQLGTGGSR